ncbi:MAG: 1-acyl-sn-glycerol-3-phosphate acyltransferase [Sphingobacteriia bacterium]|nr:1-acyl-sn-glycerol-3-phosphate acyltransferase [Sphingobacteriia bacterium]
MIYIRSLIFNIFYITWTFFIAALLSPLLINVRSAMMVGIIWAKVIEIGLRVICGIKHKIINKENAIRENVIYACKHESAWETIMFFLLAHKPAYVLKRELVRIPVFGWYFIGMKMIFIDRKAGVSALKKLIKESKEALINNRQIVIFPEGTRIKHGEKGKIQVGTYVLYKETGAKVVPVALNSGKFWGKNSFLKFPGTITVKFHDPLPEGLSREEFELLLNEKINL